MKNKDGASQQVGKEDGKLVNMQSSKHAAQQGYEYGEGVSLSAAGNAKAYNIHRYT